MITVMTYLAIAFTSKGDDGYQSIIRKLSGQCPGNIMFEMEYIVDLQQWNGHWSGTISNRDRSNSSLEIYVGKSGANSDSTGVNRSGSKYGPAGNLTQNCLGEALIKWTSSVKPSRFMFSIKRSEGDREFDKIKPTYQVEVSGLPARPGDHAMIFITEKGKVLHIAGGA
jgi:hypothetical protein